MKHKNSLILVGILGAIAVALGALGAHGLKNQVATGNISIDQVNAFDTGVRYQMYHTLAILGLVLLMDRLESKMLKWAINCFVTGIILFSGSLYFLSTRNLYGADFLRVLGPVTPIGGLFFITGWLLLVMAVIKKNQA